MTLEELMAQHPATYKAVLDKGIAQGTVEGREAGRKAGFEEGKIEGAKIERERIQGIEALSTPDTAKVVSSCKYNPEMTKEKVALAIVEDQKKTAEARAQAIQSDGEAVAEAMKGIGASQPAPANADAEVDAVFAKIEERKKAQAKR